MKERFLIVISVDALVAEDLEDLDSLPAFQELIENGSYTKNVISIYPTLTHPVHASIITGQPSGITGITANTVFLPGTLDLPWYNRLSDIKCDTILDEAHAKGYKTACCRWPVTACAGERIDLLVPEIMAEYMDLAGGDWKRAYIDAGTTPELMSIVELAVNRHGSSLTHPIDDEVTIDCACEVIKRYRPNLLFTHPGYVDSARHNTGLYSEYVTEAVKTSDAWIRRIIDATKEAGIYEKTDFVVLSDHGHLPYSSFVNLNVVFARDGLIRTDAKRKITDWDVYCHSADNSCQIHIKDPGDASHTEWARKYLERLKNEGNYGIGSIMTADEAKERYGLFGDFSFVLEAEEGFSFGDDFEGEIIVPDPPKAPGLSHSAHGHMPERGPKPVIIGCGPHFKKGEKKDGAKITDLYGLFKEILDI